MSSSSSSSKSGSTLFVTLAATTAAAAVAAGTAWYMNKRNKSRDSNNDLTKNLSSSIEEVSTTTAGNGENNSEEKLIEQRFQMCVVTMKSQLSKLSHGQQLDYYGLYKQATIGNYDEYQPNPPSTWDIVATKKYEAWKSRKGMSSVAAMQEYIDKVITFEFTKEMMNLDDENDDLEGEAVMDVQGMGNHVSTLGGVNDDDEDGTNGDAAYPIHAAARKGQIDSLKSLLLSLNDKNSKEDTTAIDVNQADDAGQTPLHLAADQGHVECVKTLILHGANVQATDNDGISVLQAAVIGGSIDATKILLGMGADPDQQDHDGDSPRSEANNESPEMKQLFDSNLDASSSMRPTFLDNDFIQELEQHGFSVSVPTVVSTNNNNGTPTDTSEDDQKDTKETKLDDPKRPNVKEEMAKLDNIQFDFDDDGDM